MSIQAATSAQEIVVPASLERKWQCFVDVLARASHFVAALVMRVTPCDIEVFVASQNPDNPYKPGQIEALDHDLYCERVMASRDAVYCRDALKDEPIWHNPDADKLGMVCYYGVPIMRPDGGVFGTICVLDKLEKDVGLETRELMNLMRDAIEADLAGILALSREAAAGVVGLREAEDRYAAVFEQAAVGIARIGLDGRWLEANDKMCAILGYTREELAHLQFQDVTFAADLPDSLANVERLRVGQIKTFSLEKRYVHKRGHHVWGRATVSLVRDRAEAPLYYIAVVEDITERKMLEREIEQAQKLESLGRLAGGIAHEFNNYLAAISGKLYLATHDVARAQHLVREAHKQCHDASEIIQGLLTYARTSAPERKTLALDEYIGELARSIGHMLPENIISSVEIAAGPMPAKINAIQIQQIILNLINNARDAVEGVAYPKIVVRLEALTSSPEFRARHPSVRAARLAKLDVIDNGKGFPMEDAGKIFDPFFTTKPVGKGTGLGLAIVASLVQQHGGVVEADSSLAEGARFTVFLPLVDKFDDPAPTIAPPQYGEMTGAMVLVVDDNVDVLDTTCELLEMFGYRTMKARNGVEALGQFESAAKIDCVLTDYGMPLMNGGELARRIFARNSLLPIVMMSGYGEQADSGLANVPVLHKPIHPKVLKEAIARALHR